MTSGKDLGALIRALGAVAAPIDGWCAQLLACGEVGLRVTDGEATSANKVPVADIRGTVRAAGRVAQAKAAIQLAISRAHYVLGPVSLVARGPTTWLAR